MVVPDLLDSPVVLIDIGAIGNPPAHWLPLKNKIHLIGFEPNEKECERLNDTSKSGLSKEQHSLYLVI